MVPTSKCSDVGDHICAVVYTTSYVRQIWVGAIYYTARTYIGHDDRELRPTLLYIRGSITEIGYFASWVCIGVLQFCHKLSIYKIKGFYYYEYPVKRKSILL